MQNKELQAETKVDSEQMPIVASPAQMPQNPMLADSAIRDALLIILRVAASMVTTGISNEISEWDLPKTTPNKTKLKIVHEADKWNNLNRLKAIELKSAYDLLCRHFR